jgi:hypothetical protein
MTKNILDVISSTVSETISFGNSMLKEKMTELKQVIASQRLKPSSNFPMIHLPRRVRN